MHLARCMYAWASPLGQVVVVLGGQGLGLGLGSLGLGLEPIRCGSPSLVCIDGLEGYTSPINKPDGVAW